MNEGRWVYLTASATIVSVAFIVACSSQRGLPDAEKGDAATGATAGMDASGGTAGGAQGGSPDAGGTTPASCTLNERQCNNGKLEECQAAGWTQIMACEGFCLVNKCVACKPEAKQCKSDQPEVCDASGAWTSAGPRCDSGCSEVTGLCNGCSTVGEATCTGKQVYKCSTEKKWLQESTCTAEQGCIKGACTACDPGVSATTCENTNVLECGSDGQWKTKAMCAKGCVAGTTTCRVCTPNTEKRCAANGSAVEKCNATGSAFVTETACAAPTNGTPSCANNACGEFTCNDGLNKCGDGTCRTECPGLQGLGFLMNGKRSEARSTDFVGKTVVGNFDDASGSVRAFRWTQSGGMQELILPQSATLPSRSTLLNRAGTIAYGGAGTPNVIVGWMPAPFVVKPNYSSSVFWVSSIDSDGSRLLIETDTNSLLWQSGVGITKTVDGKPLGMSNDANVIITTVSDCFSSNGVPLPKAADNTCFMARTMSKDGNYVFGVGSDYKKLGRWKVGTTAIEEIALRNTINVINVVATNEDGSVVIGYAVTSDVDETYWVWSASNGFKYLSEYLAAAKIATVGWSMLAPNSISGDGKVIVGFAFNASNDAEAFRLVVP